MKISKVVIRSRKTTTMDKQYNEQKEREQKNTHWSTKH